MVGYLVGWLFGWYDIRLVEYFVGWLDAWLVVDLVGWLGSCGNFGCVDDSPRWSWDDEDGPQTRGECRELDLLLKMLPSYHS